MSTLVERLTEVMRAKEWTYGDLVRHSGQSRSVVSQWLGRGSKTIKTIGKMEAAERLEQASGYAALWLATGNGPKMAGGRVRALAQAAAVEEPPAAYRPTQSNGEQLAAALRLVVERLQGLNEYRAAQVMQALQAATRPVAPVAEIERDLAIWLDDAAAAMGSQTKRHAPG